jgi:hypothetical protein
MMTDKFCASSGLTVGRCVKRASASVSVGLGPEISEVHDQIGSHKKKIKTLTAKSEAEVKGFTDRIMKKIEVDTELSLQREQHQLKNQALLAQHTQETQLLQNQVNAILPQQDRFLRRHLENAHVQKQAAVAKFRGQLENKRLESQDDDSRPIPCCCTTVSHAIDMAERPAHWGSRLLMREKLMEENPNREREGVWD